MEHNGTDERTKDKNRGGGGVSVRGNELPGVRKTVWDRNVDGKRRKKPGNALPAAWGNEAGILSAEEENRAGCDREASVAGRSDKDPRRTKADRGKEAVFHDEGEKA